MAEEERFRKGCWQEARGGCRVQLALGALREQLRLRLPSQA